MKRPILSQIREISGHLNALLNRVLFERCLMGLCQTSGTIPFKLNPKKVFQIRKKISDKVKRQE